MSALPSWGFTKAFRRTTVPRFARWEPIARWLLSARAAAEAAERDVRALVESSAAELKSFGGDPSGPDSPDWSRFRPLRLVREEDWSDWLAHLLEWVQVRLDRRLTVGQLADQARMSKRTLSRRFAEATGTSPLDWITTLRLRRAKDLLEMTALSVEAIAERCGFGSAPALRHHFRPRVKVSPNMYRSHFRRSETKSRR